MFNVLKMIRDLIDAQVRQNRQVTLLGSLSGAGSSGEEPDLNESKKGEWAPVTPLQTQLRDVLPLDASMLPITLYGFVVDQAYRFNNSSPEYVMSSTLTCAAALIGTSCQIAPKRYDKTWTVAQALWGLIIGDPSRNKSGTMSVGSRLLKHAHKIVIDPNNQLRKEEAANAKDKDDKPVRVPQREVMLQDCTPEALLLHMVDNPNGCMVCRDEIYGWLSKMEKGEHATERALYTEGFAGNNEIVQKRVSRDPLKLEDFFVSVFGCIQPDRLRPLLAGRANGQSNDGFFERFQLIIFDNNPSSYTDHPTNPELLQAMQHVFCCLASLHENGVKATLNFSEEAQNLWDKWARAQCDESQHVDASNQAIMGKYPSLVAKLSLIFQLFADAEATEDYQTFLPGPSVNLQYLQIAINLSELLMSHNRRIQGLLTDDAAVEVAERLLRNLHKLGPQFDFRTLSRKNWKGLSQPEDCEFALRVLEQYGYVRTIKCRGKTNRELIRYETHPDYRG